ncbi:hypothetical protein CVT25_002733 [Psilocybe cyanescens]|uniref:Nephrocystin 3-like N-terminal domain-containing protein n=1 Tax=Psilocybe cyanescens TaxID=93625 RepID=A0A409WL35_PSICY|nr:hypothetical protein CVT25_002733 [Psilocybe cyanescens]
MPSMFSSHTFITGGTYQQFINDSKGGWDLLVKAASPAAFHNSNDRRDPPKCHPNTRVAVLKKIMDWIHGLGGWDLLVKAASPAAFHNSNDRRDPPKCHPNTRVAVLKKIMDWIHGLGPAMQNALIMWLYGPAGAGKSAIAQSIAELCYEEGILIASYFFSRFDSTRNHPRSLIATIAYQISLSIPNFRERIKASIDHDPLIFDRSLSVQMSTLVIQPLQDYISSDTAAPTRVIIIDGLDECEDRQGQVEILATISKALQQHRLPFIFLVASRPEHDIKTAFGYGYLKDITARVPLDDEYRPSDDIRLFLQDSFTEIKEIHPFRADIPDTWPDGDILESLVKKSSGQFIYASTVIKFVKSNRHRPPQRLEIVLGLRPVQRDMPFAELDALYMHILSSAENPEAVLQILAYEFLTSQGMHEYEGVDLDVLSLQPGDVAELFCDLTSLVSVTVHNYDVELDIFHASLEDFLLDQSRSQQFWINSKLWHAKFAHIFIHYVEGELVNAGLMLKAQVKLIADSLDGTLQLFLPQFFLSHFKHATPTPDLLEDLRQISIWSILQKTDYQHLFPEFLASIEEVGFEDWFELYSHQLHLFDQIAQGIMEKMYSRLNLTALVAVFNFADEWEQLNEGASVLFQLERHHTGLYHLFGDQMLHEKKYREIIGDFLEDPTRCGIYGLTGKSRVMHCTIGAIRDEEPKFSLVAHLPPPTDSQPKKSNNTPFGGGNRITRIYYQGHADRSVALIGLARQRIFWSLSCVFPDDTRTARREVVRYLARVDAGETRILVQSKKRNRDQPSEQSLLFPTPQSYACSWECLSHYGYNRRRYRY